MSLARYQNLGVEPTCLEVFVSETERKEISKLWRQSYALSEVAGPRRHHEEMKPSCVVSLGEISEVGKSDRLEC